MNEGDVLDHLCETFRWESEGCYRCECGAWLECGYGWMRFYRANGDLWWDSGFGV